METWSLDFREKNSSYYEVKSNTIKGANVYMFIFLGVILVVIGCILIVKGAKN